MKKQTLYDSRTMSFFMFKRGSKLHNKPSQFNNLMLFDY